MSDMVPAILLGGGANALSVARSLGKRGVPVIALNQDDEAVLYSRYLRRAVPCGKKNQELQQAWTDFLLGSKGREYEGAVVLACSDAAIEFLLENRGELAQRYVLDLCNPEAQLAMLEKLRTYELAHEAGIPTPRFWKIAGGATVNADALELAYPAIVKPLYSHHFEQKFGVKFFFINSHDELKARLQQLHQEKIDSLLLEFVPGPDSLLRSYYTYLDEQGAPLFHYTKGIVRRYPVNMGAATMHVTVNVPELSELALRLFRHIELRGLANIEFKYDSRDGLYKIMEVNARFTGANPLLVAAGLDLGWFVYCRLTGRVLPKLIDDMKKRFLWEPIRDWHAFRALHRRGDLSLWEWLKSLYGSKVYMYFCLADPTPGLMRLVLQLKESLHRVWQRF